MRERFASLLRRHGKDKELHHGHLVHTQIVMLGYEETTYLANSVIEMYGNCEQVNDAKTLFENLANSNIYSFNIAIKAYSQNGMLDLARELFWKMPFHDVVSWSTMIGALSQWGHYAEALDVYFQMLSGSIKPDNITFVCTLNACSYLALLKEGIEVHASIVERKFESEVVVGTGLINMYGKCGLVLHAANVFYHIPIRDTVCWNALMTAYAQNGHSLAALSLFKSMLTEGIELTSISFLGAVEACARLCLLQEGQRIHAIVNASGFPPDCTLQNALLDMYGKCGSLYLAGVIFENMPVRDTVSWTTMVAVLTHNKKYYEALKLYDDMRGVGVRPNNVAFISALGACANLEALKEGQSIHNTIVAECVCSDSMVEIALMHMYGKCRSLCSAKNVFCRMVSVNVIAWNVMIASLVSSNYSEDALHYFYSMLNQGLQPDDITLATVLDACSWVNGLLLGQHIHTVLSHLGYQLDRFIQTSLVSMYGRRSRRRLTRLCVYE
ncbi:hypothetical protein L7F22_040125 [Adiantum nelumboides]|nr:hypothetical protein [Adiantum nelumboides]